MKKIFLLFILLFSFNTFSANDEWIVVASSLRLREKPSLKSKVITTIKYGEKVKLTNNTEIEIVIPKLYMSCKWTKIQYKGLTGYVADCYLIPYNKDRKLPPLYLKLKLTNGKIIKFQNKPYGGEAYITYSLIKYDKNLQYYIIGSTGLEWYNYIIVDAESGKSVKTIGEPVFSPDKKYFFSFSCDLEAQHMDSGIEIYNIENRKFTRVYKLITNNLNGKLWGPQNGKWIDSKTFTFDKIRLNNMKEIKTKTTFTLKNGKWTEKKE